MHKSLGNTLEWTGASLSYLDISGQLNVKIFMNSKVAVT